MLEQISSGKHTFMLVKCVHKTLLSQLQMLWQVWDRQLSHHFKFIVIKGLTGVKNDRPGSQGPRSPSVGF